MKEKHQSLGLIIALTVLLLFVCAALGFLLLAPEQTAPVSELPPTVPVTAPPSLPETTAPTEAKEFTVPTVPLSQAVQDIQAFAQTNNLAWEDYPDSIVALLERNPETEEFVLNYPLEYGAEHEIDMSEYENCDTVPLFMQWDRRWGYIQYGADVAGLTACGPVCLSMVAYYLTRDPDMSPDKMIRFAIDHGYCIPGNGSAWSLISEGGRILGLTVTEITRDESRVLSNLEAGHPIICIMGPGDFTSSGHFIVMVGTEDGLIQINDPNSYANSEKLWDFQDIKNQIRNLWVMS